MGPINSDVTKTPVLCTLDDNYEFNRNRSPVALGNSEMTALPVDDYRQLNTPIVSDEEVIDQSDLKSDHSDANAKSDIISHGVAANLDQVNGSTATIQDSPKVIIVKQDLEGSNRVNEPSTSYLQPQTWSRNQKIMAAALLAFLIAAAIVCTVLSQTTQVPGSEMGMGNDTGTGRMTITNPAGYASSQRTTTGTAAGTPITTPTPSNNEVQGMVPSFILGLLALI